MSVAGNAPSNFVVSTPGALPSSPRSAYGYSGSMLLRTIKHFAGPPKTRRRGPGNLLGCHGRIKEETLQKFTHGDKKFTFPNPPEGSCWTPLNPLRYHRGKRIEGSGRGMVSHCIVPTSDGVNLVSEHFLSLYFSQKAFTFILPHQITSYW